MRSYIGHVLINNEIKEIPFETDGNPVKYLWGKFGMAVYIERIEGVESAEEDTDEKETESAEEDTDEKETEGAEGGDK